MKGASDVERLFSIFIRLRDCIKTTGYPDFGKCCTCGDIFPFDVLEAGHWLPGRHPSIQFDERACNAQCPKCNRFMGGNRKEYDRFMERTHGLEVMEKIKLADGILKKFTRDEIKELRADLREKIKKLGGHAK